MSKIYIPGSDVPLFDTEPVNPCDHGAVFDEEAAKGLDSHEVRKRWPRKFGPCAKGCGFNGVAYASFAHYIAGDW